MQEVDFSSFSYLKLLAKRLVEFLQATPEL